MSGRCRVTRCRATADCAPKLDDSAGLPWPCASAQATRASASIASSLALSASRSGAETGSVVVAASTVAVTVRLIGVSGRNARKRDSGDDRDGHGLGRVDPDVGGVRRQFDQAGAVQEIAEVLVRLAPGGVLPQQRV